MSDDNFFSKKGQRKVSSFIGQELLYDYVTDQLDDERKKSVKEFLQANRDAQADMQKIQNGLNYAQKLHQTQVSEALVNKITVPSSYSQVFLEIIRFDEWTPALKLGIEASVVALGITIFAMLIPWHKLMDLRFGSRDVILTEVERSTPTSSVAESVTSTKEDITFPDEGATTTATTVPAATKVAATSTVSTSTTSTTLGSAQQVAKVPTPTSPPPSGEKVAAVGAGSGEEKRQGELYRGTIDVTNVPAITPKLVERIQALGGRKAGQVELGWIKNEGSYFHFTMPASQYEELKAVFEEYGNLRISKEKHERVMPEGIMRIIVDVEEKK